jgi:hypothetical protein
MVRLLALLETRGDEHTRDNEFLLQRVLSFYLSLKY